MKVLRYTLTIIFFLAILLRGGIDSAIAQYDSDWSTASRIPGYEDNTWPPVLIPGQDQTVHAFSSQWVGNNADGSILALVYSQWSLDLGWSSPVAILLSPLKNEARVLGAFLDIFGTMHVIFYGGDGTEGDIYYANAPVSRAADAQAWTKPKIVGDAANDVSAAGVVGDEHGNLAVIYSGTKDGWGLYSVFSSNRGDTWSDPSATFLNYEYFPYVLKLFSSNNGITHVVWDVRDEGGNGRQINYAQLNLEKQQWSALTTLEEAASGYGVLIPTVIEYHDDVLVAYSGVTIRRSSDGGHTWSKPVTPFRHTGVNGIMSFVIDNGDNLHLLWAQRITASPDIHGVWHSIWQAGQWTEPEPVVSGPTIVDTIGEKSFDPYEVRAVLSRGDKILVTWRTDPGLNANGVWYSYLNLNATESPDVEFVTVSPTPVIQQSDDNNSQTPPLTESSSIAAPNDTREISISQSVSKTSDLLVVSLIPAIAVSTILFAIILSTNFFRRRNIG